ncbi:MAG: Gfo/Idh/MocA family oxidoreductase [Bacilli bacterium]|nr:Gfo/Idh/MocA family oxidoreductase [Bacilli bacterium]
MKKLTVAIIGGGSRGIDAYGTLMHKSNQYQVVSVCDARAVRLTLAKKEFKIPSHLLFKDEKAFFKKKLADVCIVATQDQDHVRHAIKAMSLGYHVLLEKPITPSKSECFRLLAAQKKCKRKVIVCHVLRYAPAYLEVARLIDQGTIGTLMDIDALEQVAYWHQAHSFVRGNWHDSKKTSPMILAKCCHDMDLLQYYAKSRCQYVSSMGRLDFFNKKHQPKGASKRCATCKYIDTCPYSAKTLYIKMWKEKGSPKNDWPFNVTCTTYPLTEKNLKKAYESNEYGECVFTCRNDVVDHQQTIMTFENGVTANLCMTGFTAKPGRIYKFHGTIGEIDLDEERHEILIKRFGEKVVVVPFNKIQSKCSFGHGGGDEGLVNALYQIVTGKNDSAATTLASSIESHLMCYAAEESRLKHGQLIEIKHAK